MGAFGVAGGVSLPVVHNETKVVVGDLAGVGPLEQPFGFAGEVAIDRFGPVEVGGQFVGSGATIPLFRGTEIIVF